MENLLGRNGNADKGKETEKDLLVFSNQLQEKRDNSKSIRWLVCGFDSRFSDRFG